MTFDFDWYCVNFEMELEDIDTKELVKQVSYLYIPVRKFSDIEPMLISYITKAFSNAYTFDIISAVKV